MFFRKAGWKERIKHRLSRWQRGQGFVEFALVVPVLIIVLSGTVEIGFMFNDLMALQDAARNAARFGVDGAYDSLDNDFACATTRDFYRQLGCLVVQELAQERPQITLNIGNGADDVVVSVFTVEGGSSPTVSQRHPETAGEAGWSFGEDIPAWGIRNQSSRIPTSRIDGMLTISTPNTGFVLVEIFFQYQHKLGLPWITVFIEDPLLLHVYAIMPNSSAEPTSTPETP